MKTVLLLGGPAAGQRVECHGTMGGVWVADTPYKVVPMCSHGEVHWFGVLDGADPLALLIAGYGGGDQGAALRKARATIEVLEAARPHWAQGYTSDGVAAQAMQGALSALWEGLGATNQTEAVAKLSALLRQVATDDTRRMDFLEDIVMRNGQTLSADRERDSTTSSPTYGDLPTVRLFTIPSQHVRGIGFRGAVDEAMAEVAK